MKRVYADLHLCLHGHETEKITNFMKKACDFGYSMVSSPCGTFSEDQMKNIRGICGQNGLDFVSRVDLRPRTPDELIFSLRKVRRRFEIVAVMCESKSVARQAAKDRRVDLLNFPQPDYRRGFFDAAEAELASKTLCALEVDLKPLLTSEGPSRVRLLSNLRRETSTAREFHVPIVISSGTSDELFMRRPRELMALASLFDLNDVCCLEAISHNPGSMVKRNRQKLSSSFVAPGIRIVRRGKVH